MDVVLSFNNIIKGPPTASSTSKPSIPSSQPTTPTPSSQPPSQPSSQPTTATPPSQPSSIPSQPTTTVSPTQPSSIPSSQPTTISPSTRVATSECTKYYDTLTAPYAPREDHDDVIKWEHFPRYLPFVWGIHRSLVNSPHKGQWRGALITVEQTNETPVIWDTIALIMTPFFYTDTLKTDSCRDAHCFCQT